MTEPPTTHERKVLQRLIGCQWENLAQLYAGEKTIDGLLAKGWIAELEPPPSGARRFRLADAGLEAFKMPPAPKVARPKLKTLGPRVPVVDVRIAKPRR